MTIVTDAPPVAIDCYGFLTGKKHTQTSNFKYLTRAQIVEIVRSPPPEVPGLSINEQKDHCHWWHPSNAIGKKKADVEAANSVCALWCDIDHGDWSLIDIRAKLEELGLQSYAIYSTVSHKQNDPETGAPLGSRWRILVWLDHEVDLPTWRKLSDFLIHAFGGDVCSNRVQQIVYLPLLSPTYEHSIAEGADLDPSEKAHPFIAGALAFSVCVVGDDRRQPHPIEDPQAEYIPAEKNTRPVSGPISWFVGHEPLHWCLQVAGFDHDLHSGRYRPPGSNSPHGVMVKDERAYFHHTNSPLADGRAHDGFDVIQHYLFGGDFERALEFAKGLRIQFRSLSPQLEAQPALETYPVISGKTLVESAQAPRWLIKGWLPAGELGLLVAPSQAFKSFVALEMAHCIATGRDFGPHPVKRQGPVVFVVGEGKRGFARRTKALFEKHGHTGNLHLIQAHPVLSSAADMRRLRVTLEKVQPVLVVFDTFSALSGITDENQNAAVAKVLTAVRDASGDCAVLVVHHTGKDAALGPRGASVFFNNVDFDLTIERDGNTMLCTLKGDKLKDGALPARLEIKMGVHSLGKDEDEDEITSLVVESITAPQIKPKRDYSINRKSVLIAIRECHLQMVDSGVAPTKHNGRLVTMIPRVMVRQWLEQNGYAEPPQGGGWSNKDNKAFSEALKGLQNQEVIGQTASSKGGCVFLYQTPGK